jgi:NAD(P)-dependent dehydrogenase (short-subunit alcohol dehydrogenase family)
MEPPPKRLREDKFECSANDAFATTSREGYFGEGTANVDSNATGEPRIVLAGGYGQQRGGTLSQLLSDAEAERQLSGCKNRYAGKVVIVTGGASGIGEGCVRVFFEAGSQVVICDRDEEKANTLTRELMAHGRSNEVVVVKTDVSIVADLQQVIDKTIARFGRLDCIVNNAGWHPPPKIIDDFSVDEMQDLMQLNFVSVFALCKYALPHLRKTQGNIINMSSLVGAFGQSRASTYAATKGATTAFTKALAIDEAKHNVRVNSVSPGNIWTPLWKAGADADKDPIAAREAGERVQVLGRMGSILEAGRLCLCIAADLTFTTGVDHLLTGGAEIGYGVK